MKWLKKLKLVELFLIKCTKGNHKNKPLPLLSVWLEKEEKKEEKKERKRENKNSIERADFI